MYCASFLLNSDLNFLPVSFAIKHHHILLYTPFSCLLIRQLTYYASASSLIVMCNSSNSPPQTNLYVSASANALAPCIFQSCTNSFYHIVAYQIMAYQSICGLPHMETLKDACRNAVGIGISSSTTTTTAVTASCGYDPFCPSYYRRSRCRFLGSGCSAVQESVS